MYSGKNRSTDKKGRVRQTDADTLTVLLNEKNRQIQLLHHKLKQSEEYGRNLSDLLRELVRLLAIIEQ